MPAEHLLPDGADARYRRREDDRLVRGAGQFVADLRPPGCVEAVFVHADVAHGLLRRVELAASREVPGVLAAWAAADLPDLPDTPPVPVVDPASVEGRAWPSLATDRIRYWGEAVAVVIARDRYAAEDGRDAAEVDIEAYPVLLDPTEAAGSDVRLFPDLSNVAIDAEFGVPIDEAVWRDAAVVVEGQYRQPLVAHTSLEARAILVEPDRVGPDGKRRLTVWCAHQDPHRLRRDLAGAVGLPDDEVRVVVPEVGGAFGGKSETYPEYLVVVAAARRLGRPVRWVEDRAEALAGPPHGRGQNQRTRMAADAEGRILAYQLEIDADVGGYPHTGAFIPLISATMATGAYAIDRVHVRARAVLTTTAPTSAYRGAGRPEATSAIERTVDLLARRLGMDPAELRRRNHVRPEAFPHRAPTGFTYDSGDYTGTMELALATVDYPMWREEQRRRRPTGDGPPLGIGICGYVERSGAEDEYGSVEACADGSFVALSGCCATGQGHQTSFPQVVASVLGVAPDRIRLVEADTAVVPRGHGSFASRSLQTGGAALHGAAMALIEQARGRMAEFHGVPAGNVDYAAGQLRAGARTMSLAELAAATGPLRAEQVAAPPDAAPFGSYTAVVEVDRDLGEVRILRLVAVDDYGVVVNPLIVKGQMYGSIVQGIGQALYEQAWYHPDGRPGAGSLLDYLVPTISELPPLTVGLTRTPNPNTELGAKGAGESGCIGAPPAIVNAVVDALDLDDPTTLQVPLTPYACWTADQLGVGR